MKNILTFCLLILLFSCKKSETLTTTFEGITSISGKIENWTLGSDKTIVFGLYENDGSSSIDTNGNFHISNLTIPNRLISIDSSVIGKLFKVSNHNIKTATAILSVYNSTDLINVIGHVHAGNRDISTSDYADGDYKVYYIYVNDDVSINGSSSISAMGNSSAINSSLYLKKGWNVYLYKIVSASSKSGRVDCVTDSIPSSAKWYYEIY